MTPSAADFVDSTRTTAQGADVLPGEKIVGNCSCNSALDTFEEYRSAHPEFFND
jgi:hypothetical protein